MNRELHSVLSKYSKNKPYSALSAFLMGEGFTLKEKSLSELEEIFQELRSKLDEIHQHYSTGKKFDYPMMPKDELTPILKSKINPRKKKQMLLTQIGYARINLFTEYYERIQQARTNNELDNGAELMNEYAETIVIPFISTKKQSATLERIKEAILRKKRRDPMEQIQEWKTTYHAWFEHNKLIEEFDQLKKSLIALYTISFSVEDFPPLRNKPSELD
jgi:hypothetical protein